MSSFAELPAKISLGILWLGLIVAYLQLASFEALTYDDPLFLAKHPAANLSLFNSEFWQTIVSVPTANLWHPLTDLSHQLIFRVSKSVHLHLAFNVILHGLSASFLYLFLAKVTERSFFSLALVLLFAWHPVTVESVAWISGRKDLLCSLILLSALRHYHHRATSNQSVITARLLLAATAACLCKPIAFTLPFLLLASDYWPLRRIEKPFKLITSKWPLWLISSLSLFITITVQARGTQAMEDARPLTIRLTEALWALQHGLTSCLFPKKLHLAYTNPDELSLLTIAGWSLSGLLLASILIWKKKTFPSLPTGAFWFLITIAPTLGLMRVGNHLAADRYSYLPLLGLVIGLAGLSPFLNKPRSKAVLASLFFIASLLLFTTTRQISHWKNQKSLFTHVLRHDPKNLIAHIELAQIARKSGHEARMQHHLDEALQIAPNSASAHIILAHLAFEASEFSQSYHHYEIASRLRSRETWLQERLAASAYKSGDLAKTRSHMEAAFQLARPTDHDLDLEKKWHLLFPEAPLPN